MQTLHAILRVRSVPFRGSACLLVLIGSLLATGQALAQADPKKKIPPPEDLELQDKNGLTLSKDGMSLHATYFPGTNGKETVPVIMLHMWKGSRGDYKDLAEYLQKEKGHAVLVPDLRWHGDSTKYAAESTKKFDPERLPPAQYELMVQDDVEACKKFLMDKHNAGELNIERLVVIGAEMGAVIAMNWAAIDWSWPPLGAIKRGQDVKALVLLSPEWKLERGPLNMSTAVSHEAVQKQLAVFVMHGSRGKSSYSADAKRVYTTLERLRDKNSEETNLYEFWADTALQGTKLIGFVELKPKPGQQPRKVNELIAAFIDESVVGKSYPWRDRSGPFK